MPWQFKKSSKCPKSRPYGVFKEGSDTPSACHPSAASAKKQMAALYANEDSAESARLLDEALEEERAGNAG